MLFIQSDVLEVAQEMRASFRQNQHLFDKDNDDSVWIPDNPLPVPTEREKLTISNGLPVYRAVFVKE